MRSLDEISKTNPEKPLLLEVDGKEYYRCPIHTHFIKPGENLSELMRQYVAPYFEEGDVVYISEKIVSLCQKDIIPKDSLKISRLAKFLSKFASTNDSAGIGVHNVYKDAGGHHALRQAQGLVRRSGRRRGQNLRQTRGVL